MFYSRYKRELAAARNRVRASGSQIAETRRGSIEYIDWGQGPPVLWVHGILGGADHGPSMAQTYLGEGFRVIAVSRFGYLQSPMPPDASPTAQADVFAFLLDVLRIAKVSLVGTSAGSASSLQFALRYPDRCAALVLWSMAVPPYQVPSPSMQFILHTFFGSDFLLWTIITHFPSTMLRIMGVPRSIQNHLTPVQLEWLSRAMAQFLPPRQRIKGIMNDICVSNPGMNEVDTFEQISVPKLIIHAMDDPMPSFATARQISCRLPNTEFIEIKDGGHLLLGHFEQVRAEIRAFINLNAGDKMKGENI